MIRLIIILSLFLLSTSSVFVQSEEVFDPAQRYDEILEEQEKLKDTLETVKAVTPKDELALFLPNLGSPLYEGWSEIGEAQIWEQGAQTNTDFSPLQEDLLREFKTQKVLRQTFGKGEFIVQITIYKFENFAGAYSASTILSGGKPVKLDVGKNVSESEGSLSFWKGNYFIEIKTPNEGITDTKEFIVLASKEISQKIKDDNQKPVVAVQLPALNRVPGFHKYCLGPLCCEIYFPKEVLEVGPENFELKSSGGIITADYKLSDNPADDRTVTLILSRYEDKQAPKLVYTNFLDFYRKNEAYKVDIKDDFVKVKKDKKDYVFFKQQGNMFAAVYRSPDKKSGEKILDLVPWPIDITRN